VLPISEKILLSVEGLNDARTLLAACFSILLVNVVWGRTSVQHGLNIL
jgi:hypothetical protein